MSRILIVIILVCIAIIGAIEKQYNINRLNKRLDFTSDYQKRFVGYCNKALDQNSIENDLYFQIVSETGKIQRELGADGLITFRDPAAGIQVDNYQLFVIFFNEFKSYFFNRDIFSERLYQTISTCNEALIRHIGNINDRIEQIKTERFNPIRCFGSGIKLIVSFPIMILDWIGFLSADNSQMVLNSKIIKLISSLVAFIGFVGAIVSIVVGWDSFVEIINNLF